MANVHLSLIYAVVAVLLSAIYHLVQQQRRKSPFPIVNAFPRDFSGHRAYNAYQTRAKELIADGLAEHNGPITLLTPNGPKVILPGSFADWVKSNKDLDHPALVKDDFLSGYAGFDAQTIMYDAGARVVNTIKAELTKNEANVTVINEHLAEALAQQWGEGKDWHAIDWQKDTTGLISQAAAAVFVGSRLAKSKEWQDVSVNYVLSYFTAIGQIKQWPSLLWPLAHRFNALSSSCRAYMKRARIMINDELSKRATKKATSSPPVHNDAIEWFSAATHGTAADHRAMQLALAVAALFTTSEALRQTILDICAPPDIISPLRDQVQNAIAQHGWSTSALFKMPLLDSVMKEAQRTLPAYVGLERKVVRNTTLPSGITLPRGTHLAVDASAMWNPAIYTSPGTFIGTRFLELRQQTSSPTHVFTASSKDHLTFGLGRSMCPGRFFADVELKLCLSQILIKYDVRLRKGYRSNKMYFGFYPVVDPFAEIEVRRRSSTELST